MSNTNATNSRVRFLAAVFLLSASLLALEVLLVRMVSIMLYPIATYIVISLALLGGGISGTVLALRRQQGTLSAKNAGQVSVAFTISVGAGLVALWYAGSYGANALLPLIIILGLPFLFGGAGIAIALISDDAPVTQVYFADLTGAGFGVLAYLVLIGLVGGFNLGLIIAGAGIVSAGLFLANTKYDRFVMVGGAAIVIVGAVVPVPNGVIPISPKELQGLVTMDAPVDWEYQQWNSVARIDVLTVPEDQISLPTPYDYKLVTQDGGAPSILLNIPDSDASDIAEQTIMGIPYWIKEQPKVLIIGLGGGPDVQAALEQGASEITGVEINAAMIDIVRGPFAEFTGDPYADPRVTVFRADGRNIVERSGEQYDIIQLTGVDTSVAALGGNPNLAENYLYTIEAFSAFYEHLTPDGTLSVSFPNIDGLGLRFVALGTAALDASGIESPDEHLVVSITGGFVHMLMKRTPFTEAEVATITERFEEPMTGVYFPLYARLFADGLQSEFYDTHEVQYTPFIESDSIYRDYLRAFEAGDGEQFLRSQPQTVLPPTDLWPFIFVLDKWGNATPNITVLLTILGMLFTAGIVFITAPLYFLRQRGERIEHSAALTIYFAALGLGYIFVEIVLIQKLALFLGHPSTALAVTLGTILIASGLGAFVSRRWEGNQRFLIVIGGVIALLLVIWSLILTPVTRALLGQPLAFRVALSMIFVALPGFLMGMPFPTGLGIVKERSISFVPWAWAINSVATVSGTILAVLLAMLLGFTFVFAVAVGCYALAAITGAVFSAPVAQQQT